MHVRDVLEVEAVEIRAEGGVGLVLRSLLQPADLVRREAAGIERVELAGLEGLDLRRPVHDDLPVYPRERDVVCIAPVLVLHEVDRGVVLPRLELEGPVGDDVPRLRPAVAELLDRRTMHREERGVAHLLHEPGLCGGQVHLERARIDRLDPDLVAKRGAVLLASVVFGGADDSVELIRVVSGELGRDSPLPGPLEVLGRHRVTVGPLPIAPEVEGDSLAVLAHVPALRQAGHRLQVVPQQHEGIHDVEEDVGRRHVRGEPRVERRRLGSPADRDRLLPRRTSRRARRAAPPPPPQPAAARTAAAASAEQSESRFWFHAGPPSMWSSYRTRRARSDGTR